MKVVFWFSFLLIFYTYLGYPCLLYALSILFSKEVRKKHTYPEPSVSVLIAVHNEEKNIQDRIENLLTQNYPMNKLEIIIVSDGSTDSTEDTVRQSFENAASDATLKLTTYPDKKGKAHALNIAATEATGEFLVFADARQLFEVNTIRELIANFNDPSIGCVSGELVFQEDSVSGIKLEMGAYWHYEKWIRKMEARIASVPGATGAIYAIRKNLYLEIPMDTILDDVFIPMTIVLQGSRVVFDTAAIAYDHVSENLSVEKKRKIRTLVGNYQLLQLLPQVMSPFKNPIFFQFVSHKVLRLLVPFLIFSLLLSASMIPGLFYFSTIVLAVFLLIFSILASYIQKPEFLLSITSLIRGLAFLNWFALLSFFHFFSSKKKKLW